MELSFKVGPLSTTFREQQEKQGFCVTDLDVMLGEMSMENKRHVQYIHLIFLPEKERNLSLSQTLNVWYISQHLGSLKGANVGKCHPSNPQLEVCWVFQIFYRKNSSVGH